MLTTIRLSLARHSERHMMPGEFYKGLPFKGLLNGLHRKQDATMKKVSLTANISPSPLRKESIICLPLSFSVLEYFLLKKVYKKIGYYFYTTNSV